MKLSRITCGALAGLCFAPTVWSATLIENKNPMGKMQKVLLNGTHARMESGSPDGYMLVSLKDKGRYAVDNKQKQIIDMSPKQPPGTQGMPMKPPGFPEGAAAPPEQQNKVEAKLEKKGPGPTVAGYPTEHYQVTANGQVCSDEYFSSKALEVEYVKDFISAMQGPGGKNKMPPMPFMNMDPCMQAGIMLKDEYASHGMHMKSITKDGKVVHEITNIKSGVEAPPAAFELPKDYAKITAFEMMQKAMQNMKNRPGAPMPPPGGKP